MTHYPQPLPKEIADALRLMPRQPAVFAMVASPDKGLIALPMLIVVVDFVEAWRWAKTKDLLIGIKVLSAHTANGSVMAVEVGLPMAGETAYCYTTFNPEDRYDRPIFTLLQKADKLAVGFGDYEGNLQGAKAINWSSINHAAVSDFLALSRDHNQDVHDAGMFDFDLAVDTFHAIYEEQFREG